MADIKSCGVLVFRSQPHSFLLMRHHDRWDLPKGHRDDGESETQCALREMNEETGIPIDGVELDRRFRFALRYLIRPRRNDYQALEKELVIFIANLLRPCEIEVTEHLDFQWFSWNPPHAIQTRTIDPLLHAVDAYWKGQCK